jgi:hypothetical protein
LREVKTEADVDFYKDYEVAPTPPKAEVKPVQA